MATKVLAGREGKKESYSERTQISLSKSQREKIKILQKLLGVSMSGVIRHAVDLLLKSLEEDKKMTKAILSETAGIWRDRKFTGLEYEKKLREKEERRLKEVGID